MQDLTLEELRCLEKMDGRRIDNAAYTEIYRDLIDKLLSKGYLGRGSGAQSLPCSDIATVRKLLKDKGQKTGGKKVDLVQRVLQIYSDSELEKAEIPKCYFLTNSGRELIEKNGALLLYLNAFGTARVLEPENIIAAQSSNPNEDRVDILIKLFKEEISTASSIGRKRYMTAYLQTLYTMKHDNALAQEAKLEVERLDKTLEEQREKEARKLDSVLGLSLEQRRRIQQEVTETLGEDWEKELDAKNKALAYKES